MTKTLTAPGVKKLRPGKKRCEIPDGGCAGLHLVIQPSGHKAWALRFRRPGGKTAKLTLGPVDLSGKEATAEPVLGIPLTLAGARQLAGELHRQRAMGAGTSSLRGTASAWNARHVAPRPSQRRHPISSSSMPNARPRPRAGLSRAACSACSPMPRATLRLSQGVSLIAGVIEESTALTATTSTA